MDQIRVSGKIFVGGFSRDTTKATLENYFSSFGEVDDCFIIPDKITGCSKGYGFVSFTDSAVAEQALAHQEHAILGKKVDVKPATARGKQNQEHGTNLQHQRNNGKKIFVGGLPDGLSTAQFRTHFESFGPVKDAEVMHDINMKSKGFGFITFKSEDGASKALEQRFHELNNKRVEVKMAEPRDRMVITDLGQSFGLNYGQVMSPYNSYDAPAPCWYGYDPYGCYWGNPYGYYTPSPFYGYWDSEISSVSDSCCYGSYWPYVTNHVVLESTSSTVEDDRSLSPDEEDIVVEEKQTESDQNSSTCNDEEVAWMSMEEKQNETAQNSRTCNDDRGIVANRSCSAADSLLRQAPLESCSSEASSAGKNQFLAIQEDGIIGSEAVLEVDRAVNGAVSLEFGPKLADQVGEAVLEADRAVNGPVSLEFGPKLADQVGVGHEIHVGSVTQFPPLVATEENREHVEAGVAITGKGGGPLGDQAGSPWKDALLKPPKRKNQPPKHLSDYHTVSVNQEIVL